MGAVTVKVDVQTPLGSGLKMIAGEINGSTSYATGGDYMNLASYFSASDTVYVTLAGGGNVASTEFYVPSHDKGTANSGKVRWLGGVGGGGAATDPMCEANNAKNLSTITGVGFTAIGKQF